jgi:hypothetical protein
MRLIAPRMRRLAILAPALAALVASPCPAIEMFTFFGDGSRIGLPNLEVPVEAYPGIPLRSDRLRARRRAMRMGPGSAVRIGPPGYARGITIRSMPAAGQPLAAPPAGGRIEVLDPVAEPAVTEPAVAEPPVAEEVPLPAPDPDETLGQ